MNDVFEETRTDEPTDTTAIVAQPAVVTRKHVSLADRFVGTIVTQLGQHYKVRKYGVENDWRETETVDLEFADKTRITIQLIRPTT